MLDKKALKYYRMLKIPAIFSKISKYLYFGVYMIIIILYSFKYSPDLENNFRVLYTIVIHSIFMALLPLLIKLLVRYMKFRQCMNMSLFLLLPGFPIEIVGMFLGIEGLIYIVLPIIGVLAIRSFTYSRIKSIAIIFYVSVVESLFAFIVDASMLYTLLRFTLMFISIIVPLFFSESLSYREGFDIYRIASSWIRTLLLDDEEEFSAIMNEIGFETDVKTHVMLFEFNSRYVALIAPEVHYGPFRNVGSASLPHSLGRLLEDQGINVIVLHSTGSHERNLVSFNESLRYGYDISSKLNTKKEFKEEILYEPFRVYTGFFEAFVIQTNSTSYIIISTPTRGNDDIPYEIQKRAVELGKVYGFEDIAVIDAHNVEGIPINDPQRYEEVLLTALSRSSRQCTDVYIGYGEAYVKGIVKGLCSNKVKVLTIKCNNALYGVIYLYGNNAERGVREELRKVALNYGYSDVEVVTADDHSCSGVNFDAPYYTIELNSSLLRTIEVAIKNSLTNMSKSKVYVASLYTRAKIVGPKIFKLLEIAKSMSRKVLRYLLTSYLIVYISVLIIALIICCT